MGTHPPLSPPETRATVQPSGLTLEAYASAKKLPVEEWCFRNQVLASSP